MGHHLNSKEGMCSNLLDLIQGKLQATVPFASARGGHHRANHISLRNHCKHIAAPQNLN